MSAAADQLIGLSAGAAVRLLVEGRISAEDLVRACLKQIEAREPEVQAWAFLDAEHALRQARAADDWRKRGRKLGPLHGIPVGIKEIGRASCRERV